MIPRGSRGFKNTVYIAIQLYEEGFCIQPPPPQPRPKSAGRTVSNEHSPTRLYPSELYFISS